MFPSGNGSASCHCARRLRRRCGITSIAACLLGNEGTLTADEVYSLTAYLLFINKVIPEDEVLDKQSLPKVKMPIGDDYAKLHEWKPNTPRLQGYPY